MTLLDSVCLCICQGLAVCVYGFVACLRAGVPDGAVLHGQPQ